MVTPSLSSNPSLALCRSCSPACLVRFFPLMFSDRGVGISPQGGVLTQPLVLESYLFPLPLPLLGWVDPSHPSLPLLFQILVLRVVLDPPGQNTPVQGYVGDMLNSWSWKGRWLAVSAIRMRCSPFARYILPVTSSTTYIFPLYNGNHSSICT